ncbi:MAG: TetR/AcrR family transcriptional regulator [Bacteroidales bacterium]|nr:TetR/AcrR family transcriptional regulator [Bacteroidales bacterium]
MVSKTREKLIEVARQLFVHKGIENTTMNDIAAASDKGRRTIYTYFKNKRDIYNAVIEHESETMLESLREVAHSSLPPVEKIRRYMEVRFEMYADNAPRRDSLRFLLGRDVRRAYRVRKLALGKEFQLFQQVIQEGVDQGLFDPEQGKRLPTVGVMVVNGLDFFNLNDNYSEIGLTPQHARSLIIDFAIEALTAKADNRVRNLSTNSIQEASQH